MKPDLHPGTRAAIPALREELRRHEAEPTEAQFDDLLVQVDVIVRRAVAAVRKAVQS